MSTDTCPRGASCQIKGCSHHANLPWLKAPAPASILDRAEPAGTTRHLTFKDAPAPAGGEVVGRISNLQIVKDGYYYIRNHESAKDADDALACFESDVRTIVAAAEARVRAEERGKILDTTDSGAVGSCMNCGKPDSTEEIVTPFIAAERERVWRLAKDCLSENDNWNMPVLIGAALADGVDLTSLAKPAN